MPPPPTWVPTPPVPAVRCTRLGALQVALPALGASGGGDAPVAADPAPNTVQDTDALYVDASVGRVLEVQYGRGPEVFGWHVLEAGQGRHNIPMPAPGPWTLQVRLVARGVVGPVGTYNLAVTGEWWCQRVFVACLCCCCKSLYCMRFLLGGRALLAC